MHTRCDSLKPGRPGTSGRRSQTLHLHCHLAPPPAGSPAGLPSWRWYSRVLQAPCPQAHGIWCESQEGLGRFDPSHLQKHRSRIFAGAGGRYREPTPRRHAPDTQTPHFPTLSGCPSQDRPGRLVKPHHHQAQLAALNRPWLVSLAWQRGRTDKLESEPKFGKANQILVKLQASLRRQNSPWQRRSVYSYNALGAHGSKRST